MNPYQVVKDFEAALCEYTGATYAVTTTSCTMALLISLSYEYVERGRRTVSIPARTYVGVAQSILNAGHNLAFYQHNWSGSYPLTGTCIIDSARWLRSDSYKAGTFTCLSFHWSKHLAIGQGGCILHDNHKADETLRRMRFDGRAEGVPIEDDVIFSPAYHAYMMPRDAAEGLSKLAVLPRDLKPIPGEYPDLRVKFNGRFNRES